MKLTAAIAMSYPNADVKFMDIDNVVKVAKMDGIVKDTIHLGIPCDLIRLPIEHRFISAEYCQLLLFPLSKISDDDAVEVCKIANSSIGIDNIAKARMGRQLLTDYWNKVSNVAGKQWQEIIHYCQTHSIDIGHGYGDNYIPSLIAAGVAVEKK